MAQKYRINGDIANVKGINTFNEWLVDESELRTYDQDLTGPDDSYFTALELSALDDCDMEYLMEKEKFAHPTEKTLEKVFEFYEKKAEGREYELHDYYAMVVEVFFHDITDNLLVRIAGSWMFEDEHYLLFIDSCLLVRFPRAFKEAAKQVEDVENIRSDRVIYELTRRADKDELRFLIQHFGRQEMINRLIDVKDTFEYYEDDHWSAVEVSKIISRIKKIKF